MDAVPIAEFHTRVIRDTFSPKLSDEDVLLLFGILRYYEIELAGPVLSNVPSDAGSRMNTLTRNHCGEVLAAVWVDKGGSQADDMHWFYLFQNWGSDPRVEKLTDQERARMRQMMRQMEQHPFVAGFVPEDFDPAAILPDADPTS